MGISTKKNSNDPEESRNKSWLEEKDSDLFGKVWILSNGRKIMLTDEGHCVPCNGEDEKPVRGQVAKTIYYLIKAYKDNKELTYEDLIVKVLRKKNDSFTKVTDRVYNSYGNDLSKLKERVNSFLGKEKKEIVTTTDSVKDTILKFADPIREEKAYIVNKDTIQNIAKNMLPEMAIDTGILPLCKSSNEIFYDYYMDEIIPEGDKVVLLQAFGGSGKTTSLCYMCDKLLEDKSAGVIPLFIEMKNIDKAEKMPLTSYLFEQYIEANDLPDPEDESKEQLEKEFLSDLKMYMGHLYVENKKGNLLIVLDGCNEVLSGSHSEDLREALKDLKGLLDIAGTSVIESSRFLQIENPEGIPYRTVKLRSLEKKAIKKYLTKKGLTISEQHMAQIPKLPFFVTKYAENCLNSGNEQTDPGSKAQIIQRYIDNDIKKYRRSVGSDYSESEVKFVVKRLLPLIAVKLYLDRSQSDLTRISEESMVGVTKEIKTWYEDGGCQEDIGGDYEIGFDPKKHKSGGFYTKAVQNILVKRFAFLEYSSEDNTFLWAHDIYKEWFVAMGLMVTRKLFPKRYREYVKKFMSDRFVYPQGLSALTIAQYFMELANIDFEDVSKSGSRRKEERANLYELVRNIVFFSDDIGDFESVKIYADHLEKMNECFSVSAYEMANALNGTGFSLYDVYRMYQKDTEMKKEEREKKMRETKLRADRMISEARVILEENYSRPFEEERMSDKDLKAITPEELNQYYKEMVEKSKEGFNELGEIQYKRKYDVLALLSRTYGNLGIPYLKEYEEKAFETGSGAYEHSICEAIHYHIMGGLIKYYICSHSTEDRCDAMRDYAKSYRSIGVDHFKAREYKQSIDYFEYAEKIIEEALEVEIKEQVEAGEDKEKAEKNARSLSSKAMLGQYLVRSKLNLMAEKFGNYSLTELIGSEKDIIEIFQTKKMVKELKEAESVISLMIDVWREKKDKKTKDELIKLIDLTSEIYDENSIDDELDTRLKKYMK